MNDDAQMLPASFALERYFADSDNGVVYDGFAWVWRLHGLVDLEAVQATVDEIVRRHESLRTALQQAGDRVVQVVFAALRVPVQLIDLSSFPQELHARLVADLAASKAEQSFDLTTVPLLDVTLVKWGKERHALIWRFSHAIWDAGCPSVLLSEFATLYVGNGAKPLRPLAQPTLQVVDIAAWERRRPSPVARDYWRRQLSGYLPSIALPVDRQKLSTGGFRRREIKLVTPRATDVDALRLLARDEAATLPIVLTAVFFVLLAKHARQSDLTVGLFDLNRDLPETRQIMGCLTSLLFVRVNVPQASTFRDVLRRTRAVVLAALQNKLPAEQQLGRRWPSDQPSVPSVCEVALNIVSDALAPAPLVVDGMERLQIWPEWPPVRPRTWSATRGWYGTYLTLTIVMTRANVIRGGLSFNEDVLAAPVVETLARGFERLVWELPRRPDARLDEVARP